MKKDHEKRITALKTEQDVDMVKAQLIETNLTLVRCTSKYRSNFIQVRNRYRGQPHTCEKQIKVSVLMSHLQETDLSMETDQYDTLRNRSKH